jgi:outer membrane protein assembly complex protein YaeT
MGTRQLFVATFVVSLFGVATQATGGQRPTADDSLPIFSTDREDAPFIDEIAFAGLRRISPETIRPQVASRTGTRLDERLVARDVRTLARLGWFSSIRVNLASANLLPDVATSNSRHTRLEFELQENPFLVDVAYSGSRLLSPQQIDKLLQDKKLAPRLGEPENALLLHRTAAAIKGALESLGHSESRVEIRRVETPYATVRVRFEIADGPHLLVGRIIFDGHPEVSSKSLREQMRRIHPHGLFEGLRGKDVYTREAFEEDRERLLAYYQNHGYPEARIGNARVSRQAQTVRSWIPWPRKITRERLDVEIAIEAGPLYRIESISPSEELMREAATRNRSLIALTRESSGHLYSAHEVDSLRRAWQIRTQPKPRRSESTNFYSVEASRLFDSDSRTVRIAFHRSQMPPYVVRRLEFRGIHHFPDRYFRSRILLKEGAPFDDRPLEAGLARLARTGYFKPIKKEDIHVVTDDVARTVDVIILVQELGEQRAFLTGGRGQFGNTLGIAYTVFNLLDREELLSSHIEGGPECLQLAIGLAKEGFLGSRGSLALSAFNAFLRPRLSGSVQGPFFKQQSEGVDATWSYALTNTDSLSVKYDLSHAKTQYSPALSGGVTGLTVSGAATETSSVSMGVGWTHDTGDERHSIATSISGGLLGGSRNVLRSNVEFARVLPDSVFYRQNSWAFRTTFTGVGSYSGQLPFYARAFAGDDFVRGLRAGELGPDAVVTSVSPEGETKYSASPAGANLVSAANAEYRARLSNSAEVATFFDVGSGALLPNWLGPVRPTLASFTNGILHASTGVQLQWTVPGINVPVRVYYAFNVLRLDRWLPMPDGTLFHAHDRFSAFGWALGSLF